MFLLFGILRVKLVCIRSLLFKQVLWITKVKKVKADHQSASLSQLCDLWVQCSSPFLVGLERAVSLHPVLWMIDHICDIICRYLPRFYTISSLSHDHNCDSTMIRRYHDAFNYVGSDRNYDLRLIRLRYDYYTTATKIDVFIFCSLRIVSNGSRRA